MTTELVQINPTEFGLTEETAKNIQQQFQPMLDKMVELENEFNAVVSLPIDDHETTKKAKELRLKYVKVRTGTADIHKAQKAFYLNGGRFVDGWKNAQLFASQGKESKLEEIEKHFENLEKQRIEKLQNERVELIRPYVEDTTQLELGSMPQDVFDAYLTAKKTAYNDRIEAEKKAEQERVEREKAEEAERQRIKEENERLKAEAIEREKQIELEKAKADAIRKETEVREAKIKAEADAKLKQEQEAKAKLEAELKAKADAEEKIKQDKIKQELAEAEEKRLLSLAPDKDKLNVWVDSIMIGVTPSVGGSAHKKALIIHEKFEAFKNWAKQEINSLK